MGVYCGRRLVGEQNSLELWYAFEWGCGEVYEGSIRASLSLSISWVIRICMMLMLEVDRVEDVAQE